MPTININGTVADLSERQPALLPGIEVEVLGVRLTMPAPVYARQLETLDIQAAYTEGKLSHGDLARHELKVLVETLRRNYPSLPGDWVAEWDTRDIWHLRTAMIEASKPPAEDGSGEAPSR